jgi:hypothetical protein
VGGIRAIVGHSFTSDDEDVVRAFLDYFTSLSKSSLNFSWTHAEPAEPKALVEKVISLLRECNLFFTICTRKERVIAPGALSETILPRGYLKGIRSVETAVAVALERASACAQAASLAEVVFQFQGKS